MAGINEALDFSPASMIEEVLQEHGDKLCTANVPHRDVTIIALKRNEATRWLRKSVGVVAAKDLPSEPAEENFRMGLRSGIILCTAMNKIEPGAIPKVVEAPFDSVIIPDGAPLSESQYFANIQNFLSALEERGLRKFDVSDLEQGGRVPRVVNCVLYLKAYGEWKKAGAIGKFIFRANLRPSTKRKQMVHNSFDVDKCDDLWKDDKDNDKPLQTRVSDLLSNQKPRDIPMVVEIVLSKLTEEFEQRLATHKEKMAENATANDNKGSQTNESLPKAPTKDKKPSRRKKNKEKKAKRKSKLKEEEENASSKKSFSDIINEMKKKASADPNEMEKPTPRKFDKEMEKTTPRKSISNIFLEMEKKAATATATTDIKKSVSDINKEMEKKETTIDVNNEMEKKATTETRKPVSDINKEMENKATTDATKSTIDVNNEMEKKATTGAKKDEMEKKETIEVKKPVNDTNKDMEKKVTTDATLKTSDVNKEMKEKATTDAKKVTSDVNNKMEEKATTDSKKATSNIDNKMEEKATTDTKKATSDIDNEIRATSMIDTTISISDVDEESEEEVEEEVEEEQEEEEEEEDTADTDIIVGDVEDEEMEKMDKQRKEDMEKREMERKSEREQREMERKTEMERKKEMQKKKEMERRKEMERKAAEDAREKEYYDKVKGECERLKVSVKKQQTLLEHQHKDLQTLKDIFSTTKADLQSLQTNYIEEVNHLGKHLSSLAQAASGYRKVLDENRKLYNQVQDLKGSIRVYSRVRPFFGGGNRISAVDCIDEVTMEVLIPVKGGKDTRKSFTFNRVFGPNATQASVYTDTQPLIRSVLDGYNVCIFAYGQTGSGKTFTMTGPDDLTPETMGVNYRALNDLFDIQKQRKNMIEYNVGVQMLEIYNEQIRDLLQPDGASKKLDIRLGPADGINVPDANLIPVSKTDDVIRLMTLGHKNRAVGSTAMNSRSSRSHSAVTVHVSGKDLTSGTVVRGCMHLVDLAGSERADKTEATGDRLKEATFINKSLSALGDVIASLSQKSAHVPYRNSKLTLLLQDALGGQAKTLMFMHVSPDPATVGETISTLKFAERVSTVELGAAKSTKDDIDLKVYKEQVASLKAALANEGGGDTKETVVQKEAGGGDATDDEGGAASESNGAKAKKPAAASTPAAAAGKKAAAAPAAKTGKAPAKKGK